MCLGQAEEKVNSCPVTRADRMEEKKDGRRRHKATLMYCTEEEPEAGTVMRMMMPQAPAYLV